MYSDRSWSYTTREYVNGSRIGYTSISSSVSRVRLGIRVRYDPRVPDHSAFCWIAPLGIITFRCFGMCGPLELHALRVLPDADLDLRVLEAEHAQRHHEGVVVDLQLHDVNPRGRIDAGCDLIDRKGANHPGERLVERRRHVGATQLQGGRQGLIQERVPRQPVPRGVVDVDDRVAREAAVVLSVEREHLRVHDLRARPGDRAGAVQAHEPEGDVEGVVRLDDGEDRLGPDDLAVYLVTDHGAVLVGDALRHVVPVGHVQVDRAVRLLADGGGNPADEVAELDGEGARIRTGLERSDRGGGEDGHAVDAEADRGRCGRRDVERARVPGGLGREDLEVDRSLEAPEIAEGGVHMGRLGVLHPHGDVLVDDQAEEREEHEERHDCADGRGDAPLVRPKLADQNTHGFT